jgi:16S rRNA (cytidine1402-2'-O)-methyltransferase
VISFHGHSSDKRASLFIEFLQQGKTVALVTDAGTPCVSDPGGELVKLVHESGFKVSPVPGPSALTAAFSVSGYTGKVFRFGGFFPRKSSDITKLMSTHEKDTSEPVFVFYESPLRIIDTLKTIEESFSELELVLTKELTKPFERVFRGTASDILGEFSNSNDKDITNGEWVVMYQFDVKEGASSDLKIESDEVFEDLIKRLKGDLEPLSGRDLRDYLMKTFGLSKKQAYALVNKS